MVLDALRGFAILGIILANYPEFSFWSFQSDSVHAAYKWAEADVVTTWFLYTFIDGKFYTLFSILFGVGFSIILGNAIKHGTNGLRIFYRRMVVLLLIGLFHRMFRWSGDILMLYAFMGMILPLFRNLPTKKILFWAGVFLVLPVVSDTVHFILGVAPGAFLEAKWWEVAARYGINPDNLSTYLADAKSYSEVLDFLKQGSVERSYEFVSSHRYFKVLGLFLIGFAIGRHRIYALLEDYKGLLVKVARWGIGLGLPLSVLYAWSGIVSSFPLPVKSLIYLVSVYPMGLGYAALFCLLYMKYPQGWAFRTLSSPGRMACTNYLAQSLIGIIIFYGVGFGVGGKVGLLATELIAIGVYSLEACISYVWMKHFNFGPVEWVWRMLTYGQYLPLKRTKPTVYF